MWSPPMALPPAAPTIAARTRTARQVLVFWRARRPARRTGFVKRVSQLRRKLCLALVTFGTWRDATTPLAPWAAQVTQGDVQVAVAPEALHQRRLQRAVALLQAMIRQALAKVHTLEHAGDDRLLTAYHKSLRGFATACEVNIAPGFRGSRSRGREKMIDTHAVGDTIRSIHWTTEHDHGHALTRRPLPCNHRVALLSWPSSTRLTSALSGVWVAYLRWPAGWSSWYSACSSGMLPARRYR
jgi:hypothetical protein